MREEFVINDQSAENGKLQDLEKLTEKTRLSCEPLIDFQERKIEIVGNLSEAIKSGDESTVREVLHNPMLCEFLIKTRGENGVENLQLLHDSLLFLHIKEFGQSKLDGQNLLKWMHATGLPESVLAKYSDVAYQVKNREDFVDIKKIADSPEALCEPSIAMAIKHVEATWLAEREGNKEQALSINNDIIISARKNGNDSLAVENIVAKAKFGVIYQGNLSLGEKKKRMWELIDKFAGLGNGYDAVRAMNEACNIYLELVHRQTGEEKSDSLEFASILSKASQDLAIKIGYTNALVRSWKSKAKYYELVGKTEMAKKAEKTAEKMKIKYQYITDLD